MYNPENILPFIWKMNDVISFGYDNKYEVINDRCFVIMHVY